MGETRQREVIAITDERRAQVEDMFKEMHQYFARQYTPKVKYTKSCNACSLKNSCLPKLGRAVSVKAYMEKMLEED